MNDSAAVYPERDRSAWILAQRPPRPAPPDPGVPNGVFRERERLASGELADSGVVLLTNRECPWRCVMCDLWQHTTTEAVPEGAIVRQVEHAVRTWSTSGDLPTQVKLYNSGSFFDPAAIPPSDYAPVARQVAFARNVVVESHPTLIGDRTLAFRDRLDGALEVAMGLETAHPEVLEKLNKKFDLPRFARAAEFLARERMALRAFLLVNPPFLFGASESESQTAGVEWAVKSAQFAFDCGATAVTLIATRAGNGAMERLRVSGEWIPPTVQTLEAAHAKSLALRRGRVFADTWALEPCSTCTHCLEVRRARLEMMNLTQELAPPITCARCER